MLLNYRHVPMIVFILFLVIIISSFAIPMYKLATEHAPKAEAGVLDLRSWSCAATDTVKLDGEWAFYWQELLTPADSARLEAQPPGLIAVPGNWDSEKTSGRELPVNGYATYRLKVLLPCDQGAYGIKTSNIRASNQIYVNGALVGASGKPAASPEAIVHRNTPYTAYFELNGQRELDILVQVASFKSYNTGIVHAISFGNQHAIAALAEYNMMIDGAIAAGFFFISLYFFFIYFQRVSKELLYFSLFGFSCFLFMITHYDRILMKMVPSLDVMPQLILENLAAIGVLAFFTKYTYYLLPELYSVKIMRAIDGLLACYVLLILFTPATYNALYILSLIPLSITVLGVSGYYLIRAALQKRQGSVYLVMSTLCLAVLVLNTMLNTLWQADGHTFLPVAQPLLIISMSLYMSLTYTTAFQTITQLTHKLSAMDKLKDEFLANTSHEFKSPLNGIINISQSLMDGARGALTAPQQDDLRLMRDVGLRLSALVQDILDYSRIKNRDLAIRPTHVDLFTIAGVVLEMHEFIVRNKPLELVNRVPRGVYFIYADENRLHQIIRNLIDNAIKYTAKGTVTVTAAYHGEEVWISVSDTGRGIPASHFEHIFYSYEQLEAEPPSLPGGVGLGLSITRQLVELHGGKIWVESELDIGTTMTFSMPRGEERDRLPPEAQAERAKPLVAAAGEPSAAEAPGNERLNVLIVDDDYSNLRTLLNILTLNHYQASAVSSGDEVLRRLDTLNQFDLCIIDVMMPGISGLDLTRVIREHYSLLELPILLVTASNRMGDLEAGFLAGANDFLPKPYDQNELKSRVKTLVQLKQSAGQLVQKEMAFLQAQIKPHFIYNTLNTILSFSHTDHIKARKLLQQFSIYLRYSFDFKDHSGFVSLEQELSLLQAYVEIEQARFGDLLSVTFRIDPSVLGWRIPALILQPLVENAIHHGIMKKEDGGQVIVTVQLDEALLITIEDDGEGLPDDGFHWSDREPRHTGVGLKNIHKRLLALYDEGIELASRPGEGTRLTLRIPRRNGNL